jgi:glycosyltransferase involved in cell wall biosynthesis
MKNIVQISPVDAGAGGPLVAARLHSAYLARGLHASFLVHEARTRLPVVRSTAGTGMLKLLEQAAGRLERRIGVQALLHPSSFALLARPVIRAADIVHFHVLHGGYFSLGALPILTRAKPCVWTMHDMWGITGSCAQAFDCRRWMTGCGHCPDLTIPPGMDRDGTALMWRVKQAVYAASRLPVICPSMWLKRLVDGSPFARHLATYYLANAADLEVYRPRAHREVRATLGLPDDRPIVAVAARAAVALYKGGGLLEQALQQLAGAPVPPRVLVMGEKGLAEKLGERLPVVEVGWIDDPRLMAQYLSAADVTMMTSTAENAPLTVIEALACGTPVVAFGVGGIPEMVQEGVTGHLLPSGDVGGLVGAVLSVLGNGAKRRAMGVAARKAAETDYDLRVQASRHLDLYAELAARFNRP